MLVVSAAPLIVSEASETHKDHGQPKPSSRSGNKWFCVELMAVALQMPKAQLDFFKAMAKLKCFHYFLAEVFDESCLTVCKRSVQPLQPF